MLRGAVSSFETTEHKDNFSLTSGTFAQGPTHDAAGNLTFDGVMRFEYDAWNRLSKAIDAYIRYGKRTVYSRGWLLGDLDDDGAASSTADGTVMTNEFGTSDPASRADLDGDGDVDLDDFTEMAGQGGLSIAAADPTVNHPRHGSFRGRLSAGNPAVLCEFGHQGLAHDEEFDLVYNRARMLIPFHGRFGERDPMEYGDGINLVAYASSRPLIYMDPSGKVNITCPPGWWPSRRPGYQPTVSPSNDAPCGTSSNPFPSSPPGAGGADFSQACRNHDLCYQECDQTQNDCDLKFRDDMVAACNAHHPEGPGRQACQQNAAAWFIGIQFGGGGAHTSSQSDACVCTSSCNPILARGAR